MVDAPGELDAQAEHGRGQVDAGDALGARAQRDRRRAQRSAALIAHGIETPVVVEALKQPHPISKTIWRIGVFCSSRQAPGNVSFPEALRPRRIAKDDWR